MRLLLAALLVSLASCSAPDPAEAQCRTYCGPTGCYSSCNCQGGQCHTAGPQRIARGFLGNGQRYPFERPPFEQHSELVAARGGRQSVCYQGGLFGNKRFCYSYQLNPPQPVQIQPLQSYQPQQVQRLYPQSSGFSACPNGRCGIQLQGQIYPY